MQAANKIGAASVRPPFRSKDLACSSGLFTLNLTFQRTSLTSGVGGFAMRILMAISILISCLQVAKGGQVFTNMICVWNWSTNEILVRVDGLASEGSWDIGRMVSHGAAGIRLSNPQALPEAVTIYWSVIPDYSKSSHTNISLSGLPKSLGDGRIYFELNTNLVWRVGYEPPNPQGGSNGRQPFSSDTNSTPGAAASRRSP